MGEKLQFVDALSDLQKAKVADIILPGIHVFLKDVLAKENLSKDADSIRLGYVSLLTGTKTESRESLARRVKNRETKPTAKHEACCKTSKLGQVKEKRLISIRQFQITQNEGHQEVPNKMASESPAVYTTDDESRLITGDMDDNFVALTKSEDELSTKAFSKVASNPVNSGYLYHKGSDGLRRRWCVLEDHVMKCYKRQNQHLLFDVNFRDGDYSAIQGRIGKMFAIRLSCVKTPRSYLFASPKAEVCASWMMKFSTFGVELEDDILRKVSMNRQNNNKIKWASSGDAFRENDEFPSDINLLEALEFLERSRGPRILPKRSSYSFKELDVLKKLKTSLISKKAENKLNRRKTWSAGSLPYNIGMIERFRKPASVSDGDGLASEKSEEKASEPNKTLPEILTSSGVVKIEKQDSGDLGTSVENVDVLSPSEDEMGFAMSMPEGLNKHHLADTKSPCSPHGSIVAQSVPDLLILPGQESPNLLSPKPDKQLKPTVSLTRAMSIKASMMKNAIIAGLRRKGRRGSGRVLLDREYADVRGCLFRKKTGQWKQRWCVVTKEMLYVYRDASYEHEDFNCSLRKCFVVRGAMEPGRAHTFKLVRRRGDEVVMAAEDENDLERWMTVLKRETAKQRFSEDLGHGSRSSSLTTSSLYGETVGDSSAAEDTPTDVDRNDSYCCETTDKDSSDEHNVSSVSMTTGPRGLAEKGYVYYLVGEDTWEHCLMEVDIGVLSIYTSETKEITLQRDHIAFCDIQENSTDGQRSYKFVLKRAGRKPIYLEVDSETDYLKWLKCFKSWKRKDSNETDGQKGDILGHGVTGEDITRGNDNLLNLPRSSPVHVTPATSDSDCCTEGPGSKKTDLERPKIRRSMTSVLNQLTPKVKRRNKSSAAMIDISEVHKNAVKSSYLYYKANTDLWVKRWCVLEAAVIYCFNSPEDTKSCFSVDVQGSEVRRTSCKAKNFTFVVFNRAFDQHFEFAGESTYVMYGWMRVLKIAAGLASKEIKSDEMIDGKLQKTGDEKAAKELKGTGDNTEVTAGEKASGQQATVGSPNYPSPPRSAPTSPKKKNQITSLDQVLKLLHEKQLKQEMQNKDQNNSERLRKKWQYSMLVALRKSRSMTNLANSRSSTSVGKTSATGSESTGPTELDQNTARVKYREISEKYDHMLEEEKLKMLRRETLLKKRRNSLILHQDILEKKLAKCRESTKAPLKKRHSKADSKEMATFTKSDGDEVEKQLAEIRTELDGIKKVIETNTVEQRKISNELNEKKRKELHDLRISVDMSPQTSKASLGEKYSILHRRQVSDSSLSSVDRASEEFQKLKTRDDTDKPRLTQSLSSPSGDLRMKAKSFSSPRLPKVPSSPILRARTIDNTSGPGRPGVKSRSSQEALSLALSQIEDFEAFVQGSFRNNGADVGC